MDSTLYTQQQAIERISEAFLSKLQFAQIDRLALSLSTGLYLKDIFPNYNRSEIVDGVVGALMLLGVCLAASKISPWLAAGIIAGFLYRIMDLKSAFVDVLRAHPEEVRRIARHWCDCPENRKDKINTILNFCESKPVSDAAVAKAFCWLFDDINERMDPELKARFQRKFCQDQCDLDGER